MRGVLYRTDEDGNPLETPELKVSAINGSNIKVYANQEAKNAALENGDIKPGDVVLSGGTGKDAPIEMDYANSKSLGSWPSSCTANTEYFSQTTTDSGYLYVNYSGNVPGSATTYVVRAILYYDESNSVELANVGAEYPCITTVVPVKPGMKVSIKTSKTATTYGGSITLVPFKEI